MNLVYNEIGTLLQRFNLEKTWMTSNVFLLHLAFCNLVVSCMDLPFNPTNFFYRRWIYGETMCKVVSAIQHLASFAGVQSLALVALTRAISIFNHMAWEGFCTQRNLTLVFGAIWLYVFLILSPFFFSVSAFFTSRSPLQGPTRDHTQGIRDTVPSPVSEGTC